MKTLLLISSIIIASFTSCKSKKAASNASDASGNVQQTSSLQVNEVAGKTIGKVSHQYRTTGCATVVIINSSTDEVITLIPKDALPEKLNVDGMKISFDYRPLKMHNPEGCAVGIPAELTNVISSK